jgi:hypothetical protein
MALSLEDPILKYDFPFLIVFRLGWNTRITLNLSMMAKVEANFEGPLLHSTMSLQPKDHQFCQLGLLRQLGLRLASGGFF